MPLLASLLFVSCLAQDQTNTYGKTNAQILAMGRKRWYDFFIQKSGGEATVTMSGAEGLYGDALAWRNARFGKARIGRLRKLLQDTKNDAVEVGTAITGGGTMWNTISASLYADAEQTLFDVLSKTGRHPHRRVSEVDRAYARLRADFNKADTEPAMKKSGLASLASLRRNLDGVIAEATRQPRKGSDTLLDFCVKAMEAGQQGG